MTTDSDNSLNEHRQQRFCTTSWSLVLEAGRDAPEAGAGRALEQLCRTYWLPLYVYVRRRVGEISRAQDLTQEFFARLLEQRVISHADPERGRFRTFLLTACQRFLANEWRRENAQKRGGDRHVLSLDFRQADSDLGWEPEDASTPEQVFERQWAVTLLEAVLERLDAEYRARDRGSMFGVLREFLTGTREETLAAAASALGMQEGAVKVAVHRLRRRYRELIREEIGNTVETADEIDDEIQRLFQVLSAN